MRWVPLKDKGFTITFDGEVYKQLLKVEKLLSTLKKEKVDLEDWGEHLIAHGAEYKINGKYHNYTWSVPIGPNGEVRIGYVEYYANEDDDVPRGRSLNLREWFRTRDKGES